MKNKAKQLAQLVNKLNGVIHRENLYVNGRRAINAHVKDGFLCVTDLHTEDAILLVAGQKLTNGYGSEVCL